MKIALCIIIKDDSEVVSLAQLLETIIPYVDSVHVTANGKETTEIESLMSFTRGKFSDKLIEYTHLPWKKDFSEQRNYNFSLAPKDTDYILWLDSDDLFVGGESLRSSAKMAKKQKKDVVFFKYWYGCEFNGEPSLETFVKVDIEQYRERLIRPGSIKWIGRLHETPVPVSGQKDNYTKVPYDEKTPIAVMHKAQIGDSIGKLARNQEILELQLKGEGENRDPRTLLYLMRIYAEIGDDKILEKCIEMGHEYLIKSGWDEERANANDIMAICSVKLNRNHDAIKYLHKAIQEYPHYPLHYIRLSLAYFTVGRHKEAKHWLIIAGQLEIDDTSAGVNNVKEMNVLFAQMTLKITHTMDKDIDKAVIAAKALLKEQPIIENEENLLFLLDRQDLYNASKATKVLLDYLSDIGDDNIINVLDKLPHAISDQPWATKVRQKNIKSRTWGDKEICYLVNFGGKHFEKWDGNSIEGGIGGSETAVIKLSEEWVSKGYRVTVYGDPQEKCEINGVTYLPWYHFNKADKFNIFIQWRSGLLAPTIKAKKFYIDLHDVVAQVDYQREIMNAVDGIFFKSQYHADMIPELPEDKKMIIGNGINKG